MSPRTAGCRESAWSDTKTVRSSEPPSFAKLLRTELARYQRRFTPATGSSSGYGGCVKTRAARGPGRGSEPALVPRQLRPEELREGGRLGRPDGLRVAPRGFSASGRSRAHGLHPGREVPARQLSEERSRLRLAAGGPRGVDGSALLKTVSQEPIS